MSDGLAILSGLLRGLPGLTQGMESAEQEARKQKELQLQEESRFTDIAPLAKVLNLNLQSGMPTRVPTAAADLTLRLAAEQKKQTEAQQRAEQFATQFEASAPTTGETQIPYKTPIDPKYAQFAAAIRAQGSFVPGDLAALQNIIGVSGKPKVEYKPGKEGYYSFITDPHTGELVRPPSLVPGVEPAEGKSVYTRSDIENQLKAQELTPGTKEWYIAYNDLARTIPVPQGGQLFGIGTVGAAQPGATPERLAIKRPGATILRLSLVSVRPLGLGSFFSLFLS